MKAINILFRVDGVEDFFLIQVLGEGQLNQDTINFRVLIELCY